MLPDPLSPDLLRRINEALKKLPTDDARQEALSEIMDGICRYCYCVTDGPCYCWNDD